MEPRVIFEDPHLIVVAKPAGLLSQGEHTGDANLVDWCRQYFGRNYVGLVHRLDRNTSGLMVVAKRTKAAQRLTASLKAGQLERAYLAWVWGRPPAPIHWVDHLLKSESDNRMTVLSEAQARGRREAKQAILDAEKVRESQAGSQTLSLMRIRLETGRSHQIRAQFAHHGHPLVGDTKYGRPPANAASPFPRIALHSYLLAFPHPMSGERMSWEEPLPRDLSR